MNCNYLNRRGKSSGSRDGDGEKRKKKKKGNCDEEVRSAMENRKETEIKRKCFQIEKDEKRRETKRNYAAAAVRS